MLAEISMNAKPKSHLSETKIYACQQPTSAASSEERFQCESLSELKSSVKPSFP
jgi:hypothetical protein